MSQGKEEEFCVHILKSFTNQEGGGGGGRERSLWETPLFLKDQMFGGNLERKAEPVLILMKHCLFKDRKKVGLKTNDVL
jgi:hypothetical protein